MSVYRVVKKISDTDLCRLSMLQAEYGLSLSQMCRWLEKRRNIIVSRQTLYNRLQTQNPYNP